MERGDKKCEDKWRQQLLQMGNSSYGPTGGGYGNSDGGRNGGVGDGDGNGWQRQIVVKLWQGSEENNQMNKFRPGQDNGMQFLPGEYVGILNCIRSHIVLSKQVLQSFRNMFRNIFQEHVSWNMFPETSSWNTLLKHIPETLENPFIQN